MKTTCRSLLALWALVHSSLAATAADDDAAPTPVSAPTCVAAPCVDASPTCIDWPCFFRGAGIGSYSINAPYSGVGVGIGATTASGFQVSPIVPTIANVSASSIPYVDALISGGVLTSANAESPYPTNRVSFSYSYLNQFQVTTTAGLNATVAPFNPNTDPTTTATVTGLRVDRLAGFNLHRYDVGVEKTIFGGVASLYFRAPYLNATDNIFDMPINGFGNLNAGVKVLLLADEKTGNVASAGLTVAAPTARPFLYATRQEWTTWTQDPGNPNQGTTVGLPATVDYISVNPMFLQPWLAGQINGDRLFVQGYVGALVPMTDQFATSLNSNISVGYRGYRGMGNLITAVTPILNLQVLTPIGTGSVVPSFPTQLFLTEGLEFMFGTQTSVYVGLTEPIAGGKAFDVGGTVGVNFYF